MSLDWQPLVDVALAVRANAYCPYSDFAVGAALLLDNGEIVPGCNVENRSYGLSLCAERGAVVAAAAAGHRRFQALVVASGCSPPARPCGQCLDTLAEFAPELPILLVSSSGDRQELRLSQLLPQPFALPPRED